MKTISIVNQKGGVGKTTTSINLAAAMGIEGKKILLIDLDPQANATTGLGFFPSELKGDVFSLITKEKTYKDIVKKNVTKNVDLLPSSIDLAGADIYLSSKGRASDKVFDDVISEISKKYDYCVIDCPPSLGLLNRNSLSISDGVIIPIQTEYYALDGLTQLLSTISLIKKMYNPNLRIEGILLTMFDKRTNLNIDVVEEIKKFFSEKTYKTIIPRNIKLAESPSVGQTIFDYAPSSPGAKAYRNLALEVIK